MYIFEESEALVERCGVYAVKLDSSTIPCPCSCGPSILLLLCTDCQKSHYGDTYNVDHRPQLDRSCA